MEAYDNLLCGDTVDDSDHQCGVYRDKDFKSATGYTYAGLESRDLSDVKLISFVGCNTASNDDNLCSTAVSGGANCAIGFTSNIHSRTSDGKNWLINYHNALYNGATVKNAINAATAAVPNSDLGDYIKIYGDKNTVIKVSNTKLNETVDMTALHSYAM